ncbi:MAG: homocysteine S-methyltransferase [Solirubrobacterales bacterium]
MNPIEKILKDYQIVILDGALATELEARGCNINDDLWSAKVLAENPEIIKGVHYDYFAAGADCATTSSYQATIEGFSKRGYSREESIELIKRSVYIARIARDDFWESFKEKEKRPKPIIAASVGPFGAYLADGSEYRGHYNVTENELIEFHRPRIKALIEAGADILACETIPCLIEAKAIVKLLEEFKGVYCWVSFSAKNSSQISDGTTIAECAEFLDGFEQVAAIGINCTKPQYIPGLVDEIKKNSRKPVVVYPNSGEEYDAVTKTWHGDSSSSGFCEGAKIWYEHGARLIGGCCKTSPEDIRAISKWFRGVS